MFKIHAFSNTGQVHVRGKSPPLSPALDAEVEKLWQKAISESVKCMFNGNILSAISFNSDRIECDIIDYRRFIAQQARPDLFDALLVQPVAVSGVLSCSEGLIIGHRGNQVVQNANSWELVPSGSIDAAHIPSDGMIDYKSQLLTELQEETGISQQHIQQLIPFCLVEDQQSHVLDIGIRMSAIQLDAEGLHRAHTTTAMTEYTQLKIIPHDSVNEIMNSLIPVSALMLNCLIGSSKTYCG